MKLRPAIATSPEGGVVSSATAAAHQAVRPHHLGRLELRLELPATGAGEPHGGLGGRVLLPPALDLGGRARVVLGRLFGLGQRVGRLRHPFLGPLQRRQRADQLVECVAHRYRSSRTSPAKAPVVGRRSPLGAIRGPAYVSSYLFQPSTRCTGPVEAPTQTAY